MKISLKVSPNALAVIQKILLDETQKYAINQNSRCKKSMRTELFEQFSKACLSYASNPNGKVRSVTMRYHLAHSLLELVTECIINRHFGTYEMNVLEMFKNQLHQKLL